MSDIHDSLTSSIVRTVHPPNYFGVTSNAVHIESLAHLTLLRVRTHFSRAPSPDITHSVRVFISSILLGFNPPLSTLLRVE